jgi:hypothetical protein
MRLPLPEVRLVVPEDLFDEECATGLRWLVDVLVFFVLVEVVDAPWGADAAATEKQQVSATAQLAAKNVLRIGVGNFIKESRKPSSVPSDTLKTRWPGWLWFRHHRRLRQTVPVPAGPIYVTEVYPR